MRDGELCHSGCTWHSSLLSPVNRTLFRASANGANLATHSGMRDLAQLFGVLLIVACSSERAPTNHSLGDSVGGAGQLGGANSDAGARSTAGAAGGEAGRSSGGASDAGSNSTAAVAGDGATCATSTPPNGAPKVDFSAFGPVWMQSQPPKQVTVEGEVLVERTSIGDSDLGNQSIYLVGSDRRRYLVSVNSPNVDPTKLARGSKLWLSAFDGTTKDNPYAQPHRSMQLSLRAEQNGPILLAALQGFKPANDSLLGVPLATASWCSATTPTGNKSLRTGGPCSSTYEQFTVSINAPPVVDLAPGKVESVTLGAQVYDASLRSA